MFVAIALGLLVLPLRAQSLQAHLQAGRLEAAAQALTTQLAGEPEERKRYESLSQAASAFASAGASDPWVSVAEKELQRSSWAAPFVRLLAWHRMERKELRAARTLVTEGLRRHPQDRGLAALRAQIAGRAFAYEQAEAAWRAADRAESAAFYRERLDAAAAAATRQWGLLLGTLVLAGLGLLVLARRVLRLGEASKGLRPDASAATRRP